MAAAGAAVLCTSSGGVGVGGGGASGSGNAGALAATLDAMPFEQLMSGVLAAWELDGMLLSPLQEAPAGASDAAAPPPSPLAPEPSPRSAAATAAGAGAAPPLPAGARRMRCLDGAHDSATCALCAPPPLEGEEGASSSERRARATHAPFGAP
jgi:hypothetical protein